MLGEGPQKAIDRIARTMETSRYNAGRLVMTESAYFAGAAQGQAYRELGVERYEIVATLDSRTSEICREMDGRTFEMQAYEAGVTAPPFHVYCRSTTAPAADTDFEAAGRRAARGADGKVYSVPGDMTYEEWEKAFRDGGEKKGLAVVKPSAAAAEKQVPGPTSPVRPRTARDVTQEYLDAATPGKGSVTCEDGYRTKGHQDEIKMADWLLQTFGGDIKLLLEATDRGIKMPDYLWNEKKWELKGTHSISSADKRLQHAIKQIKDNPGGVILDILEDLDMQQLERQILGRFLRSDGIDVLDIMLMKNGSFLKILRYKK